MRIAKYSLLATGVMSGIQGVFSQSQGIGATVSPVGPISLGSNANVSVALGDLKETSLLLCQTLDGTTAFKITELAKLCGPGGTCPNPFTSSAPNVVNTVSFKIDGTDPSGLSNFFFCLTTSNDNTCGVYSEVFNIADLGQNGVASSAASFTSLSTPITLQNAPSGALITLAPTGTIGSQSVITQAPTTLPLDTSSSTTSSISTSFTTQSLLPTGTTTISPAATGSSAGDATSSSSSSSSKGGLSLGAKIGIALGAAAFVIILLLLALFCLRRRHAKRSASSSEQVMLTRSGLNDSRDLMTEKESSSGSPLPDDNDTDSGPPILPVLPVTRHSALSPYETLPSQPYSGIAASVPRSKTNSADSDTLGRVISHRSERTIDAPAGASSSGQRQSFLGYHGIPNFPAPGGFMGSLENEDSHSYVTSEEEARRLEEVRREEEEERRIDAAIAEAERRGPLR